MISKDTRIEIRRLFYAEHWKVGTIAAQLGVHRDAVMNAINGVRFSWRGAVRPSALDPYVEFIADTLKQYPGLTGTRVWEMVRERGYEGSPAQVRRRIRHLGLRPGPVATPYLRLTPLPGEQAQTDWGHFGRMPVGNTDRPLYCFVVALAWSSAFHVYFSFEQTMGAVLRGHVEAMDHFGGVARRNLYDNMKTVVLERAGDAVRFHPRLLELAGHYHFAPVACRPRRPNEKPRVERKIRFLRTSLFAGRHFADLADLRRQFEQWRETVAYRRPCPSEPDITVGEALRRERKRLLPLPVNPINTDDMRTTVARKQPYVIHDTNRYSIPHELVGVPLTVLAGDRRIRILRVDEVVADHPRCWGRRRVIEERAHLDGLLRSKRRGRTAAGRNRLLDAVPEAQALYAELAERGESMGPNTAALLQLLDRYGRQIVADAIRVALERGTPRAASVEHIINRQRRDRGQPPSLPPLRFPGRPTVSDLKTHNHNLEDYDELIGDDEKP